MLLLTTLMYPESLYSHKLMFRNQTTIGFNNEFRGFILKINFPFLNFSIGRLT